MTACRLTRCSVCAMALRCALGAQQGRERRAERVLCSSSLCRPRPAAEPQAASCVHAGVLQRIVWYAFQQTGKSDGSLWLGIWVMMMRVARGIQEHKQKEERRRLGGGRDDAQAHESEGKKGDVQRMVGRRHAQALGPPRWARRVREERARNKCLFCFFLQKDAAEALHTSGVRRQGSAAAMRAGSSRKEERAAMQDGADAGRRRCARRRRGAQRLESLAAAAAAGGAVPHCWLT